MESDAQPSCYLITFRTYGTWLHGDSRGSVDRRRNASGQARIPGIPAWEEFERGLMKGEPVLFTPPQRDACSNGIRNVAKARG